MLGKTPAELEQIARQMIEADETLEGGGTERGQRCGKVQGRRVAD
jgi:hypothetical protein